MEIKSVFDVINKSIEPFLTKNGFTPVIPEGTKKDELPVNINGDNYELTYMSENNAVMVQWNKVTKRITLNCAAVENGTAEEYGEVSLWLYEDDRDDERDLNDAKSIANDFSDSLVEIYGSKERSSNGKLPTVSRNAVKNGSSLYDEKTLATRLAVIFPELKEDVRYNVSKYGDFLPEEFFRDHASKCVLQALKNRDKQVLKKLFNCLNEMYEDGSNAVQGTIAVTLLGSIEGDETLMSTAKEYMDEYLEKSVVSVNKILAGRSGARIKRKLENPPVYKEKKRRR